MKLIDGTESIFGCRRRLQHSQKILPGVLGRERILQWIRKQHEKINDGCPGADFGSHWLCRHERDATGHSNRRWYWCRYWRLAGGGHGQRWWWSGSRRCGPWRCIGRGDRQCLVDADGKPEALDGASYPGYWGASDANCGQSSEAGSAE